MTRANESIGDIWTRWKSSGLVQRIADELRVKWATVFPGVEMDGGVHAKVDRTAGLTFFRLAAKSAPPGHVLRLSYHPDSPVSRRYHWHVTRPTGARSTGEIDLASIIAEVVGEPVVAEPAGETTYGLRNRPPGPGAVPRGFVRVEPHPDFRYGAIVYPQPLDPAEARSYEITRILTPDELDVLAEEIAADLDYPQENLEMAGEDEAGRRWFAQGVGNSATRTERAWRRWFAQGVGKQVQDRNLHVGDRDVFAQRVLTHLRARLS